MHAAAQPGAAYVLNLCTAATPQALQPATPQALRDLGADLARFTFFTSRSFEGGRERFRLHMGYFSTSEEAEQWLAVMRDVYPAAWAGLAAGQSEPPVAPSRTAPSLPPPAARRSTGPGGVPTLRAAGEAPDRSPSGGTRQPTLSDSQVLSFLQDGNLRRRADDSESVPVLGPAAARGARPAPRSAPGHFAVQLQKSRYPVAIEDAPPLPVLGRYTLYSVEGVQDGERWYGLRAGFFTDPASAQQLALAVRDAFEAVSVVRISSQEVAAACGADDSVERVPPAFPGAAARDSRRQAPASPRTPTPALIDDEIDGYEALEEAPPPSERKGWPFLRLLGLGGRKR
jgi:hypothetical protein